MKEEKKENEFSQSIADIEQALKKNEDYKIVLLKTREENKFLKSKLEMIENEKIQKKICFHCKDYYTPLLNTDVKNNLKSFNGLCHNTLIIFFIL